MKVKFNEIPEEDRAALGGMPEDIAEDVYNQYLANSGKEPANTSGESPDPDQTPATETTPQADIPLEDVTNPSETLPPTMPEGIEPTETPVPKKGDLSVALKQEREKSRLLKQSSEDREKEWEKKFSSLATEIEALKKMGSFGTIPMPKIEPPVPAAAPAVAPVPVPFAQTPAAPVAPAASPAAPVAHPAVAYRQEIIRQAREQFKADYGREPRTDALEDMAGVLEDTQILQELQSEKRRQVDQYIKKQEDAKREQEETVRKEQERVQSVQQTYADWARSEDAKEDSKEVLQFAVEQVKALPEQQKKYFESAFLRCTNPTQAGANPSEADVINIQNFWQNCRYALTLQKIRDMENAPSVTPEVPAAEEPETAGDPEAVAAMQKKLDGIKNLPRTNLVGSTPPKSPEWSLDRVKQMAKTQEGWDKLPENVQEAIRGGYWPPS